MERLDESRGWSEWLIAVVLVESAYMEFRVAASQKNMHKSKLRLWTSNSDTCIQQPPRKQLSGPLSLSLVSSSSFPKLLLCGLVSLYLRYVFFCVRVKPSTPFPPIILSGFGNATFVHPQARTLRIIQHKSGALPNKPKMPSESTSIQSDVDGPTPFPERSITLRVGERLFTTFPSTLVAGSSFFASLLSTRWAGSKSDDDCYFVDADPELFAHILSYLRREVLPIIYDKSHGFDHAFYQALEVEAGYFGVEKLRKWVGEKGYLRAVTIQYSVEEVKGEGYSGEGYSTTVDGNTERSYYPSWTIDKVYQCPRGIFVHSGNPGACGRACESAKGDGGNQYVERSLLRTLIVTKRTIFNDVT